MKLRTYQDDALRSTVSDLRENRGCLIVMATGLGKTVTLAHIVSLARKGRVLVIAHREELIHQLAQTIRTVTHAEVGIEMADWTVDDKFFAPNIVVATVQSLMANKARRLHRLVPSPHEWSLTVVDEAHHVPADQYRRLVDHMTGNNDHRVLGVTATPDRLDRDKGGSLSCVFDKVSFEYGVDAGIRDGWLVPIQQRTVYVEGLDYSDVKTTAGDLNPKQLRMILEKERIVHSMVKPSLELIGERQAVFYAASCDQGRSICEIFNRYKPGCARFVDGKTPKDERRTMFVAYRAGEFQVLVNVGVLTEGWDCPEVEVVIFGKATKSRAWYTQCCGRGLRPLPGIVESRACDDSPDARRAAIAASAKPFCEVIDFHGNAGRHKLVWVGDILGGTDDKKVSNRAREIMEDADGELVDPDEALQQARLELEERQACERAGVQARTVTYKTRLFKAFDHCDLGPEIHLEGRKMSTLQQCQWLLNKTQGRVDAADKTYDQAQQLIENYKHRAKNHLWTWFQESKLRQKGVTVDSMSFEEASRKMERLAATGFRRPIR